MKSFLLGTGIAIVAMAAAIQLPPPDGRAWEAFVDALNPFTSRRPSHGRCSSTSLKTLTSAQADFRANDRDGDGVNQFWRGDVTGLYALVPKGSKDPIKLIELSVAAADDRPVIDLSRYANRAPKSGYRFRAIRHADEDPKALDPQRFAFCAYPASPYDGKYVFVVDENNTIFRAIADGRRGMELFPTDDELRLEWSKLD